MSQNPFSQQKIIPQRIMVSMNPPKLGLVYKINEKDKKKRIYEIVLNSLVYVPDAGKVTRSLLQDHPQYLTKEVITSDRLYQIVTTLQQKIRNQGQEKAFKPNKDKEILKKKFFATDISNSTNNKQQELYETENDNINKNQQKSRDKENFDDNFEELDWQKNFKKEQKEQESSKKKNFEKPQLSVEEPEWQPDVEQLKQQEQQRTNENNEQEQLDSDLQEAKPRNEQIQKQQQQQGKGGKNQSQEYFDEDDFDEMLDKTGSQVNDNSQDEMFRQMQYQQEQQYQNQEDEGPIIEQEDPNQPEQYIDKEDDLELEDDQQLRAHKEFEANQEQFLAQPVDVLSMTNSYGQQSILEKKKNFDYSELNSLDSLIMLFQEFIYQNSSFFFDYQEGDKLLKLHDELQKGGDIGEMLEEFVHELMMTYYNLTQNVEFDPSSKLFFPFEKNKFGFVLLEMNPILQQLNFYYFNDPPQQENLLEEFENFVNFFEELFKVDYLQVSAIKLDANSVATLEKFDDQIYVQYILMLFNIIYEEQNEDPEQRPKVNVDFGTLQRLGYVFDSLQQWFKAQKEKPEAIELKFDGLLQKMKREHKQLEIVTKTYNDIEKQEMQFDKVFGNDINKMIQLLDKDKEKQHILALIECILGDYKFSYYVSISRGTKKKEVRVFMLNNYGEFNEAICDVIFKMKNNDIDFKAMIEYSRHSCLYEYNNYTLTLWSQLVMKKKMTPLDAISLLNFSMIPYYSTYAESGLN